MNLSSAGYDYLKRKEDLRLAAYQGKVDRPGVYTIGWGHTGPDVYEGLTITRDRADELLAEDVAIHEAEVRRIVTVKITQGMFDALVIFDYNCGGLELVDRRSNDAYASRALLAVNEGRFCDAVEEMVCWNQSAGEARRSLLIRRLEEGLLFCGERFPE